MQIYPHVIFKTPEISSLVTRYNKWFVNLRYLAVVLLLIYIITLKLFPGVYLSGYQFYSMTGVMFLVLVYNIVLEHYIKITSPAKSKNALQYALLQILFDLISLAVVVYMSGGLEAPIFMFFVFHMIIGSVLLPERIIYLLGLTLIALFTTFSVLEYNGFIPHQKVSGLFQLNLYDDLTFVFGSLLIFSVMILSSIYLTKRIAMELYDREKELRKALEDLADAEVNKQKYTMAVVHELKSPIAAASSFLDIVLGGYSGKIDDDARDKISKAKIRVAQSIENINNILRISKFKVLNQVNFEKIIIHTILDKIKANAEINAARKDISLKFEIKPESPEEIMGDPVLVELALSNLVNNAVKYTPEHGNVLVQISGEKELDIRVIDDGIGIPAEDQNRIFDDFYRASNAKNSSTEGTGTGLSIVKSIFESHNGSIKIVSPSILKKNNRPGTEFRAKLPVNNL